MKFIDGALGITIKDLKTWLRNPFLALIAVGPLLVITTAIGLFIAQAEVMPTGLIMEDNDPMAIELADFMTTMRSGTGAKWFNIQNLTEQEIVNQFANGKILSYIVIPDKISSRISNGEIITINVYINNINDDITKNVMQRLEYVSNHFNRKIIFNNELTLPVVPVFETGTAYDYTFQFYTLAGSIALAVIMVSSVNTANNFSVEFEKNTMKNLVMISSPAKIITGKVIVSIIQSLLLVSILLVYNYVIFGFVPHTDLLTLLICFLWGFFAFSSLGLFIVIFIKKTIPAAMAALLLIVLSWYVGGGLVPAEIWPPSIRTFSSIMPTTYFYRSFIQILLKGSIDNYLLLNDLVITIGFGIVLFIISIVMFQREVRT